MKTMLAGATVALLGIAPSPALAGDPRPTEMPYETPADLPTLARDYRTEDTQVVRILDDQLSPRIVNVGPGERLAWLSYSRAPSAIVFEREMADSIVCRNAVNFSLVDDELRSAEIHAGEFASFCECKPGRYRYRVVREVREGGRTVRTRLEGQVVVSAP